MKKLTGLSVIILCLLLSGCTAVQYTYLRNLTEQNVEVYFDFNAAAMKSVPDSIYVPYSSTAHTLNTHTPGFMTDSILAKRYTGTTLHMSIPAGAMVMFDKTTAQKIGYHGPEKIRVAVPGKEPYTVRLSGDVQAGEKKFQQRGNSPKIYWHDIY